MPRSRIPPVLALLAGFAACAHDKPLPSPAAPDAGSPPPADAGAALPSEGPLPAIRTAVDGLLRRQAELYWKNWVYGDELDLAHATAGAELVLAPESLAQVREAKARAAGEERRALEYLEAFLVGEAVAHDAGEVADRLAGLEVAAAFVHDGKEIPLRRLPALLAAEPDAAKRASLRKDWGVMETKLLPLYAEREERLRTALAARGFADPAAVARGLRFVEPQKLAALAEAILGGTDALYRKLLDDLAPRELSLSREKLRGRDLPRLLRGAAGADAFPAAKLADDVTGALRRLGLDSKGQRELTLDTETRPKKNPRAIALPVEVPGDVRVSVTPTGGPDDYRALLHELGHAEAALLASASPMEFRRLGPRAPAEALAHLFEGLVDDPGFARERGLEGPQLQLFLRLGLARRLHQARRAAARVLFSLAPPEKDGRAQYARIFGRAEARPLDPEETALWQTEREPLLESADELLGMALAAELETFLDRQTRTAWWKSPSTGLILASLLAPGSGLTATELAAKLGRTALDGGAFTARARERLAAGGP